ncbi:cytidylyltransferase domain-containing protein [Candidatus Margulisiibacteriota bacterium]
MNIALLIGREGSVGYPGKNVYPLLGRPLMAYPLLAAINSKLVDKVYISTDSPKVKEIGRQYGVEIIDRPDYLCTKEAHGEDVFVHGYKYIKEQLQKPIETMVLLHCNAPCVLPSQIDEGIKILKENKEIDSAVTVSKYNMFAPTRARRITSSGLLDPFIPFENYPKDMKISCDRDEQGDCYFADVCLSVVQAERCLEDLNYGSLPQRWMGKNIHPLIQEGGLDVDYDWQMPMAEFWLKKNGFKEDSLPYPLREKTDIQKG